MSLLRYFVLHANYVETTLFGAPIGRGEIVVSQHALSEATGLSRKQIRTALQELGSSTTKDNSSTKKGPTVLRKGANRGADRTNLYLVVAYDDWTTMEEKGPAEGPTEFEKRATEGPTHRRTKVKEVPLEPLFVRSCPADPPQEDQAALQQDSIQAKIQCLQEQYPEAQTILDERWLRYAPLPKTAQTPSARLKILDTIRKLHTADGNAWELVGRIVEHAARYWQPQGYMGSPKALRTPTKKGDRQTWEVILQQVQTNNNGHSHEGDSQHGQAGGALAGLFDAHPSMGR